jgi:hypothetical protein
MHETDQSQNATNAADVPPAPPEAHQEANTEPMLAASVGREDLNIPKTADAWDLYSDMPGAEEAAQDLGRLLEELVATARNSGNRTMVEACRIRDLMYLEMARYQRLGTRDTEPEAILVITIQNALGLTEQLCR